MTATYEKIATATSSNNSTITFSTIPGTYTDLVLIINGALSGSAIKSVEFNSDTAANYSCTALYGTGSSAISARYAQPYLDVANAAANQFVTVVQFMNYANTTTYKTYLSRQGAASTSTEAIVGTWRSTSAITTIDIKTSSNNFGTSTFALYGIKAE
jgi:hypothetical protein